MTVALKMAAMSTSLQLAGRQMLSLVPTTWTAARVKHAVPGLPLVFLAIHSARTLSDARSSSPTSKRAAATSEAPSSSTTSTSSTSSLATTSISSTLATTELSASQSNSSSATVSKPAATDQAQQTQNSAPPAGLSTAAVAGISIGLTLAIVTAVAFLILWLRSRRRARLASQPTQPTPAPPEYEQYKANEEYASAQAQRLYWQPASHEPVEIMGSTPQPRAPIEM